MNMLRVLCQFNANYCSFHAYKCLNMILDKSPRTNLQSLRDNLLKATAIHFEQIFLDEDVILGYGIYRFKNVAML